MRRSLPSRVGLLNADDYYHRASSIRVVANIRIPTLIIHAERRSVHPFRTTAAAVFSENPYILMLATERGGHVAFISVSDEMKTDSGQRIAPSSSFELANKL